MKYALIGCGRISPNHIEAAKNNHLDFVAMCDVLPEAMQAKAAKFGLENVRQYTDYPVLSCCPTKASKAINSDRAMQGGPRGFIQFPYILYTIIYPNHNL